MSIIVWMMNTITAATRKFLGAWPLSLGLAARGVACFLGGFTLWNLLVGCMQPGYNGNLWWINLRPLPGALATVFLLGAGCLLVAFGCRATMSRTRRRATLGCCVVLLLFSFVNLMQVLRLQAGHAIHLGFPLPFSGMVFALLLLIMAGVILDRIYRMDRISRPFLGWGVLAVCLGCMAAFPLAQLQCFGKTDYRRRADIIVVLGAQAFPDGTPSQPLAERVTTACALYRQGYAPRLFFSGGPSGGGMYEAESMRRLACRLGVPDDAMLLDKEGVNTEATVRHSIAIFRQLGVHRVLVVSHFYHLPRIKLAYGRAGWEVCTVPAAHARLGVGEVAYLSMREMAAFWCYYFR